MSKIFVAGHRGLVGSAVVRALLRNGVSADNIIVKTSSELDLRDNEKVRNFFAFNEISQVYLAAAHVGGIVANDTYPADFIFNNLMLQTNVIHNAYTHGVKKFLFLGSTCVYPKLAKNPIKEEYLLTGKLEKTNEAYAVAKIAGIKMCESYSRQYDIDYRSVLPCNLFGPGDNYDLEEGHVTAGIIHRMHVAKRDNLPSVTIWGTGNPRREFLYVDDMADACLVAMNASKLDWKMHTGPMQNYVNISVGYDITIKEMVDNIKTVIGYKGEIIYDTSRPDGTMNKLTDNSNIKALGWKPKTFIMDGLIETYEAFKKTKYA